MDCSSNGNQNIDKNGSNSTGKETNLIAEEDLELNQTISRSRNPSSDLVIAPEPVLAEVTKADVSREDVIIIGLTSRLYNQITCTTFISTQTK